MHGQSPKFIETERKLVSLPMSGFLPNSAFLVVVFGASPKASKPKSAALVEVLPALGVGADKFDHGSLDMRVRDLMKMTKIFRKISKKIVKMLEALEFTAADIGFPNLMERSF